MAIKISKFQIYIILLVVIIILLLIAPILSKKRTSSLNIPLENNNQLPNKLQIVIKELEKNEYIGLTQSEIEKKLEEKGLEF